MANDANDFLSAKNLRDRLRLRDEDLARRADVLWKLSDPIHARATEPDANECGRSHCEKVEEYIWRLIQENNRDGEFRNVELFLLSCAACCHDFDKGLKSFLPEDAPHGVGSGGFVVEHRGELVLSDPEATAIDYAVSIHDLKDDHYLEKLKQLPDPFRAPFGEVNLQRLALLLKAADVLHTDNSRISDLAVDVSKLTGRDRAKHLARQCIYGWGIERTKVVLDAYPETTEQLEALLGCKEYLREREWRPISSELRYYGFAHELDFNIRDRRLPAPRQTGPRSGLPGMDHFHEADAPFFAGRDDDRRDLLSLVFGHSASKLVGPSGVGKSSLIHAGILPRIGEIAGWRCVVTRPNKADGRFFTGADFETVTGPLPEKERGFLELCEIATRQCEKLLVALDQFEDIAYFGWFDVDALAAELLDAQNQLPSLRYLFSYREDVESILCELWNKFSHSSRGLPTHPMQRLPADAARESLKRLLEFEEMKLEPPAEFVDLLVAELVAATDREAGMTRNAVYPPFIQMVLEHLKQTAEKGVAALQTYRGQATDTNTATDQVIANYLEQSIERLRDRDLSVEDARRVLVALARTSGSKGASDEGRIAAESRVPPETLTPLLHAMAGLRLVRPLVAGQWEIVHDLLARRVIHTYVDEEERRFKHVREALESRARTFHIHHSVLTRDELRDLWLNRDRINRNDLKHEEFLLVFVSMFSPDMRVVMGLGGIRKRAEEFQPDKYGVPSWWIFGDYTRDDLLRLSQAAIETGEIGGLIAGVHTIRILATPNDARYVVQLLKRVCAVGLGFLGGVARESFVSLATRENLPVIRNLFEDKNSEVRESAVEAWGRVATREDLPDIRNLLKDKNSGVRESAVQAWEKVATREDLADIRHLLRDVDSDVCGRALQAWEKMVTRGDLAGFRHLLVDEDSEVRRSAVQAWGGVATREDLADIRHLLRDVDWDVRGSAVRAWGKVATREDLADIRAFLKDKASAVRGEAVKAWESVATREDLAGLRHLLVDDDWEVRESAVQAWGKVATHEDLAGIRHLLRDVDSDVRRSAVEAWGGVATHEDLTDIRHLLGDEDSEVCESAERALWEMATREDLAGLRHLLLDKDCEVRESAVQAWGKVATRKDLPDIRQLLKDEDRNVRRAAVEAWGKVATREDFADLRLLLEDEDWNVRHTALEAWGKVATCEDLADIRHFLKDDDSYVRGSALQAWGKVATREHLGDIQHLLIDPSENVASTALGIADALSTNETLYDTFCFPLLDSRPAVCAPGAAILCRRLGRRELEDILERSQHEMSITALGVFDWFLNAPPCLREAYEARKAEEERKKAEEGNDLPF